MDNTKCKVVMVIFAYNLTIHSRPWIYGVYEDHAVGLKVQEMMQDSEDYGHLFWTNHLIELK